MFRFTFLVFGCTLAILNAYPQTSYEENMSLNTFSSIDSFTQSLDLTGNQLAFIPDEALEQVGLEELNWGSGKAPIKTGKE